MKRSNARCHIYRMQMRPFKYLSSAEWRKYSIIQHEEAKVQARSKQQKEEEELLKQQQQQQRQHQHSQFQSQPFQQQLHSGTPPPVFVPQQHGHWPGDPLLTGYTGSDSEYCPTDQPTLSSMQPDFTLQTPEYKGTAKYGPGMFAHFLQQNN